VYLILVSNHEWERERENGIEKHYYYLRIYEREYERILKTDRLIEVKLEPNLHHLHQYHIRRRTREEGRTDS
jgi:hypothetical protein